MAPSNRALPSIIPFHSIRPQKSTFPVIHSTIPVHPAIDRFPMMSCIRGSLIITPRIIPRGGGAACTSNTLRSMGKPNQRTLPACKLCLGIAICERPALLVEQRECFQLLFDASLCNLPSWRYSQLEITLSFQNAQSMPLLVSRPLYKGLWAVMVG